MHHNHNSTGPRTAAGKQRSSLNALRHGLTGQTVVVSPGDLHAHTEFCDGFFRDFQPKGALESQLVQTIASCFWRLNRIAAHEQTLLSLDSVACESQINTQDDRALAACAAARAFEMHNKLLANLTLYEQRISRQYERALKLLVETQAARNSQQASDLSHAIALKEHHDQLQATELQPVLYNPANDGFVFSNGVIAAQGAQKERLRAALIAKVAGREREANASA